MGTPQLSQNLCIIFARVSTHVVNSNSEKSISNKTEQAKQKRTKHSSFFKEHNYHRPGHPSHEPGGLLQARCTTREHPWPCQPGHSPHGHERVRTKHLSNSNWSQDVLGQITDHGRDRGRRAAPQEGDKLPCKAQGGHLRGQDMSGCAKGWRGAPSLVSLT